jgi:hypothetical protein
VQCDGEVVVRGEADTVVLRVCDGEFVLVCDGEPDSDAEAESVWLPV